MRIVSFFPYNGSRLQFFVKIILNFNYTISQPEHLLDDADVAVKRLGYDRALKESYLFQSLLKGNSRVAFGSDWPVS